MKKIAKKDASRVGIVALPLPDNIVELGLAYHALHGAADAVLAVINQPRAESFADGYLEQLWEGLSGISDDAAAKLEGLKPKDAAERDARLWALLLWHAPSHDTQRLVKYAAEAVADSKLPR